MTWHWNRHWLRFVPRGMRLSGVLFTFILSASLPAFAASSDTAAAHFRKTVQPILTEYCYDCHGDGAKKGNVAFDELKTEPELVGKKDLWLAALKNVRAGLMPPDKKPKPSAEEVRAIENWIKHEAFGIDPSDPDPGRVTIRRLNRVEYRNTIRDLMGFDFKVEEELPPDDTGYGFDNIGDVLTISPMLLEKYMKAAELIVTSAVPTVARLVPERSIAGKEFRSDKGGLTGEQVSFYKEATLAKSVSIEKPGTYRIALDLTVRGSFDFDPGRCTLVFKVGDRELLKQEFGWEDGKKFHFDFDERWDPGERRLAIELKPLVPAAERNTSVDLRIAAVTIHGPLEKEHWGRPKNFELFFWRDPPDLRGEQKAYAREVLERFATKAYRRPVNGSTVDRLVAIAENVYTQPGKRFEEGVTQAMIPVIASPRFLFRVEETEPATGRKAHALVDEYTLASRLSYFLWSTMPDEQLSDLTRRGELRKNLHAQVKRMLADARSREFVENFVGQWLQVRDVDGIDINARVVLARDAGEERELERMRRQFREQQARQADTNKVANPQERADQERQAERRRRFFRPTIELDRDLRRAMRQETEMLFARVLREDRSVLELIASDYTFLNEKLAKHYGITNVTGNEMRLVKLPEDHPRGGVLTHGSVLVVTSNPTRTSPVKRGLFVLDNILGTPPPPPPADIPDLEESEKEFKDREPTLREVLAIHRGKPLCSSCHNRMDPLGLALENFNALGMWRESERGQPVDAAGKLITGEPFNDVRDLKRVLVTERRVDFYRCLTEKLLTYALGRGVEYYDVHAVDLIVERLERENGKFSALLAGVIESAPFQKRRTTSDVTDAEPDTSSASTVQARFEP